MSSGVETAAPLPLSHAVRPGPRGYWRRPWGAFARRRSNWIPVVVLGVGLLMALTPTVWLPGDPTLVQLGSRLKPPAWSLSSDTNALGTDVLGRDVLSRVVFAARWTFLVAFSAVAISAVLGSLAGLAAGFFRGSVDAVLARLMDMQLAFPAVLLAISMLAVAGPSLLNMILVLGLVDWAQYARVIRSSTLSVCQNDYIDAARAVGATSWRIVLRHVLPNVMSPILVLTTFSAARLMLTESALSFLGLGVAPPATTWGAMIGSGRDYIYQAWWISAAPGLMITLTVLAINLLGDGLRDTFYPQTAGD